MGGLKLNRDRNVVTRAEQLRAVLGPAVLPAKWLNIPQAATYMNLTPGYVRRMCRTQGIHYVLRGGKYLMAIEDCDAHLESLKIKAVA